MTDESRSPDKFSFFEREWTDDEGTFRIPVFRDMTYKLDFGPLFKEGVLYRLKDMKNILPGSNLEIAIAPRQVVLVRILSPIHDAFGFDTWLENERGETIRVEDTLKEQYDYYFIEVPTGKVRAVVKTQEGRIFKSAYFVVSEKMGAEVEISAYD